MGAARKALEESDDEVYDDEIFPSMQQKPKYDVDMFMKSPLAVKVFLALKTHKKSELEKKLEADALLEQEVKVPFSIISGHHGGMVSSLRILHFLTF